MKRITTYIVRVLISTLLFGVTISLGQQTFASRSGEREVIIGSPEKNEWISPVDLARMKKLENSGILDPSLQYRLARQGVDSEKLERLFSSGELSRRILGDEYDSCDLGSYSLFFDVVAYGVVKEISFDTSARFFHKIYTIELSDGFVKSPKGMNPKTYKLYVLQPSGPREGGGSFHVDGYSTFERNQKYLFFLTRSNLDFFLKSNTNLASTSYPDSYFMASNNVVHVVRGDSVDHPCPTISSSTVREDSKTFATEVIDKIKRISRLLTKK
jgi:hypothetical protein